MIIDPRTIGTVFVPFRMTPRGWVKCDNIPRYLTTRECVDYFSAHPEHVLKGERISFIEHDEPWARWEFLDNIGVPPKVRK